LLPELAIDIALPYFAKRFLLQITEAMQGIFIEAAGHYQSIPGDNIGVP
jgi:hypothetical protein